MKQVALLGATGSIGDSTCAILRKHPDQFNLFALSAHSNWKKALQLITEFKPQHVVITDEQSYLLLKSELNDINVSIHSGSDALDELVKMTEIDLVVAAIVGSAGMSSVLAATEAGKTLLLANKESVVAAGALLMPLSLKTGAHIIPLDSEHNALYQCLPQNYQTGITPERVSHLTLTASGGPFWSKPLSEFQHITPAQAVAHPQWDMGAKISVDSATLMNKGLEVIEAHWLFNMPEHHIEVVVHPQSTIHSLVHYIDGSVLAQLGTPDMQIPISYGLGLRDRLANDGDFLDLIALSRLDFLAPDDEKFPCLTLAREAIKKGGTAPAVLNAANEISVAEFLKGNIKFMDIANINAFIMNRFDFDDVESLAQLSSTDHEVRLLTQQFIQQKFSI
ncbi:1-deoxy-D-xylulose-5-phosphate reductoisomerase [Marinicella rhabdoformis]|uniref:1-deoxy-D-xylulose-5-phosphate reductoisomerase n=1 Tax=Marinicella rhabdoformis TaxID=2580566 RepID=UPI0012AED7F1|nr:1-deoxy-D-xylulose-5-phosphate reductoisomerase [Marinicella rhabdoformis]